MSDKEQPTRFKPGQAVRVEGVIAKSYDLAPNPDELLIQIEGVSGTGVVIALASAVHLAPGDGERGYRALTLLRELVIGEEFAGDEYPERFRKFVSEICDLARPLIVEEENTNGDDE